MQNEIIEYLKDEHGHYTGVLVAISDNENIHIGYSILHERDKGKFNRDFGKTIAFGRAEAFAHRYPKVVPMKLTDTYKLTEFMDRCVRFFKGKQLPEWALPWEKDTPLAQEIAEMQRRRKEGK